MGMLSGVEPAESYSLGFKTGIADGMAKTLALAHRRAWSFTESLAVTSYLCCACSFSGRVAGGLEWEWCEVRGVSLGALALQWTMKHPQVSTCIIGCRTAAEVNGVCDMAAVDIPEHM